MYLLPSHYSKIQTLDGKCLRDLPPTPPCDSDVTTRDFQSVHFPSYVRQDTRRGPSWCRGTKGHCLEKPDSCSAMLLENSLDPKGRNVKINKQKLHLKWSQEARKENSYQCVTQHTLLTPRGRGITYICNKM